MSEYGFCQINKLGFFVSCNKLGFLLCAEIKKKALQEYSVFAQPFDKYFFFIVALHRGGNAFLYYFYICIKFTSTKETSTMKKC